MEHMHTALVALNSDISTIRFVGGGGGCALKEPAKMNSEVKSFAVSYLHRGKITLIVRELSEATFYRK
jgi:hypothetical protein